MTRLRWLAWGYLAVVVDLRFDGLDLVPDVFGWVLSLVALAGLRPRHPGFTWAWWAGWGGLAASLLALVGFRIDGFDAASPLVAVAQAVLTVGTCTAVIDLVPARARAARTIRSWTVGLALAGIVVGVVATVEPDLAAGALLVLIVPVLAIAAWFVALMFQAGRATPTPTTVSA